MTFRRKAALGLTFVVLTATAAFATGALGSGSRSVSTPPDLAVSSTKATPPFDKTKCKLRACAWVNKDGTLIAGTKLVVGSTRVANPGVYCVQLSDKIDATQVQFVLLTVDYYNTGTAENVTAQWYSPDPGGFWCFGNEIAVKTYSGPSTEVNAAFVIAIP